MAKKNGGGEPPKEPPKEQGKETPNTPQEKAPIPPRNHIKELVDNGSRGNTSGKNWAAFIIKEREKSMNKSDNRPSIEAKVEKAKDEPEKEKSHDMDIEKSAEKSDNKNKEHEIEPEKD